MTEFEEYLALYEIDLIHLSIEAKVRYVTVHNAKRGKPINPDNAEKIKETLHNLTGLPYTGSFVFMEDVIPPYRRIPGNYHWGDVQ
jgi:hypothetical protein